MIPSTSQMPVTTASGVCDLSWTRVATHNGLFRRWPVTARTDSLMDQRRRLSSSTRRELPLMLPGSYLLPILQTIAFEELLPTAQYLRLPEMVRPVWWMEPETRLGSIRRAELRWTN